VKRIYTAAMILLVTGALTVPENISAKNVTLYFYHSAVCPACKRFKDDMGSLKRQFPGLIIKSFELRNSMNRVSPKNRRNIRLMVNRLKHIDRKLGKKPFVIETRKAFRLKVKKGIPYYMKQISTSTILEKEFPVPAFILGDRAYTGYRKHVLTRALRKEFR